MKSAKVFVLLGFAIGVIVVASIAVGVLIWSEVRRADATPGRNEKTKLILNAFGCRIVAATVGDQPMKWSWLDSGWQAHVGQGEHLLEVTADLGTATAMIHLGPEHRGGELYIIVDGRVSPPVLESTDLGFKVPLQPRKDSHRER